MHGFEERKIGNTVFFVFANGMVPADDVKQMRSMGTARHASASRVLVGWCFA